MDAGQLLWPERPARQLQCFFLRVPAGHSRDEAFVAASRAIKSMRFGDLGTFVLRAPTAGDWFVVDWVGPFELSDETMRAVSAELKTEVLGFGVTVAHGRATDDLQLHRFVDGAAVAGHMVEVGDDRLRPVIGDGLRLPSFVPMVDLPEVSAALKLPTRETLLGSRRVDIRCVPGRLLFWAVVLATGAVLVLALT